MVFLKSFSKINKKYPQNFLSPKCKKMQFRNINDHSGLKKVIHTWHRTKWEETVYLTFFVISYIKLKNPHFICFFLVKMSLPHFFLKMFPRKLIIIFLKKLKFLIQSPGGVYIPQVKTTSTKSYCRAPYVQF